MSIREPLTREQAEKALRKLSGRKLMTSFGHIPSARGRTNNNKIKTLTKE